MALILAEDRPDRARAVHGRVLAIAIRHIVSARLLPTVFATGTTSEGLKLATGPMRSRTIATFTLDLSRGALDAGFETKAPRDLIPSTHRRFRSRRFRDI